MLTIWFTALVNPRRSLELLRNRAAPGWSFRAMLVRWLVSDNTSPFIQRGKRVWQDDNRGPIGSWEDFEQYAWPTNARSINVMAHAMAKRVPDGMKVMVIPGGVFEWTSWLMGLVPFSFALVDQPDLVDAGTASTSGSKDLGLVHLPAPWMGAQLWGRWSPRAPFAVSAAAIMVSALPARFKLKRVGGRET